MARDTSAVLAGKTAVVTGSTRGLGRVFARALAAAGADVVGVSSGPIGAGETVATDVSAYGRPYEHLAADLANRQDVARLAETLRTWPRPVDILVNNAGIIRRTPAATHPVSDFDAVVEVDLRTPFVLSQAVAEGMLSRGYGKILFVASLLSFQGGILIPGYTAAKHAIAGLVKAFANEWAAGGVNVNAVAPGYIETDATAALRADPVRSAEISSRIPAGRWGRPDDVAGALVFLAGPASDYVNGVVLPVDGGWLSR